MTQRTQVVLCNGGKKLDTVLVCVGKDKTVADLTKKIEDCANKVLGWTHSQVMSLRLGQLEGPRLLSDYTVQEVLREDEEVFASITCLRDAPQDVQAVQHTIDHATSPNIATNSAPDKETTLQSMRTSTEGDQKVQDRPNMIHNSLERELAMAPLKLRMSEQKHQIMYQKVKYQMVQHVLEGVGPRVLEVLQDAKTLDVAKAIALKEGIKYHPAEEAPSSTVAQHGCCVDKCVCNEASTRLKMWAFDTAIKIEPAAFADNSHPQWKLVKKSSNSVCPICFETLSGSTSSSCSACVKVDDVIVGNTRCRHFFHSKCLLGSFGGVQKRRCPYCKADWQFIAENTYERDNLNSVTLLVASPSDEVQIFVASDVVQGTTVSQLKAIASKNAGFDCSDLSAQSQGTTHDDEAIVILKAPAIYALCAKTRHSWEVIVTCAGANVTVCKVKLMSSDSVQVLKQRLHQTWNILPSRLQLHVGASQQPAPDYAKLADLCIGVQFNLNIQASVATESYVHIDFFVNSQRLPPPSSEHRMASVLLPEETLFVSCRWSYSKPPDPVKRECDVLDVGLHRDRQTLFTFSESWQAMHVHQTEAGVNCLLSCLYVLASAPEEAVANMMKSLWAVLPFPPLCLALRVLLDARAQQFTHQEAAAIANGFFRLLRFLVPSGIPSDRLFEQARVCLSFLLSKDDSSHGTASNSEPMFIEKQLVNPHVESSNTFKTPKKVFEFTRMVMAYPCLSTCLALSAQEQFRSIPLSRSSFPTWEELQAVCAMHDSSKCLALVGPLALKSCRSPPALTLTQGGHIAVFTGHGKANAGEVNVFSPITGSEERVNPDMVAKAIPDNGTHAKDAEPRQIIEGIMVCIDRSSSMSGRWHCESTSDFPVEQMNRMTVVKQLFNAFINRSLAYNYPCSIGLVSFGSEAEDTCALTPVYENFRDCIEAVEPRGQTVLWDALQTAGFRLKDWLASHVNPSSKPPSLRVLVLSDGEDTASALKPQAVASFLSKQGITVDSIVIGGCNNGMLHAVSKYTGGYVFRPTCLRDALRIMELEVLLCSHERPLKPAMIHHRSRMTTPAFLARFGPNQCPADPCTEDSIPPRKQPLQLTAKTHQLSDAVTSAGGEHGTPQQKAQTRRILLEMRKLMRKPHPAFDIFPCCHDTSFWNATVSGPEMTPYADGVWHLFISFPAGYPVYPPEVRFITPIKHCNINQHGRVCHSILDRNWTRETGMPAVLENVYGLLLHPDASDPLDSTLALEFYDDSGVYEASIVEHVERHAKVLSREGWHQRLSA